MPSGSKKRKSAKRKNASTSPPKQGWFRSHLQTIKPPSFRNGTTGEETRDFPENEDEGSRDTITRKEQISSPSVGGKANTAKESWDREDMQNKISNLCTGIEVATAGDMHKSENGGTHIVAMASEEIPSMSEELHITDGLKEVASGMIQEQSATMDRKVASCGGLEWKAGEGKDTREDQKVSEPAANEVVVQLTEEASSPKLNVSAIKNEMEVTGYTDDCIEAPHVKLDADESGRVPLCHDIDAITPKIEIPHPPMVLRRASIWNCCGLLEVFISKN